MRRIPLHYWIGFWLVTLVMGVASYSAMAVWRHNQQVIETSGATNSKEVQQKSNETVATKNTLLIPKLDIRASIEEVGVKANKEIDAPADLSRAGLFTGASRPGQGGTVFIDGHVGSSDVPAVFDNLHKLRASDKSTFNDISGVIYNYEVQKIETVKLSDIDMNALLQPDFTQPEKLILMTCSGAYLEGAKTYDQRTIVTAQIKQ